MHPTCHDLTITLCQALAWQIVINTIFDQLALILKYLLFSTKGDSRDSPKSRVYSQEMSSNHFMELIHLCPDNTMVGTNLLTMAKSVSSAETETAEGTCTCM